MSGHAPENITDLLLKWSGGDATALEQLMPLVYDELRRLAVRYLRRERDNHSLQPTALVNEAYLRLVDQQKVEWQSRAQFYGLAARVMRNILVDWARARNAEKRGGQAQQLSLGNIADLCDKQNANLIAVGDFAAVLPGEPGAGEPLG